jgi:translocation and assembly module TamB
LNSPENIKLKSTSPTKFRWLRRTLRVLLGVFIFLFLMILIIRSPWGQDILVGKIVTYVSNKTKTKVAIDKLFITFDGDLQLDGLYLEDQKGDTLVYSKSLKATIPLWKIIRGEAVGVDALDWDGLRANIIRKDSISGYNFQFLIDAFVPKGTTTVAQNSYTEPLNLSIGNLNFTTLDLVFDDAVIGINSRFQIGELKADLATTDIENMIFDASELELNNSKIKYIQKPVAIDTTTSNRALPKFSAKSLKLHNLIAHYESKPNHISIAVDLQDFYSEIPQINLGNNDFNLNIIRLKNSKILITTETKTNGITPALEKTTTVVKTDIQTFKWPQVKVKIAKLDLENNQIEYRIGNAKPQENVFNPNAFRLQNFTLKAKNILLQDQNAELKLNQLSFNEISGININKLAFNFKATDTEMVLKDMNIQLNDNAVTGFASLRYRSLHKLFNTPELTQVNANLRSFSVSLKELFKLQPALKNNPYLITLSKNKFTGHIKASGTLATVHVSDSNIFWGSGTRISASGTLKNITNPEILEFNIPEFSAETKRTDAIQFLNEQELGINLPEKIVLAGNLKGTPSAISSKAKLTTTQGIATIDGNFKNTDAIAYDVKLIVEKYSVNELLDNPQLGPLSLSLKSQGNGTTLNTLDATLNATVSEFQLNNYAIKNLDIKGNIKDGEGNVRSKYKDENLNINLNTLVILDSIAPEFTAEIDVIGANLQALGLMQRKVKTGLKIVADFKGNRETYDFTAIVDDAVVVYNNKTYLVGDINAMAHVTKDTTSVAINNKMLNFKLKSNSDPQTFSKALKRHVLSYFFRDEALADGITTPINLKLEGKISESPLLNDVFLVNVKDLDAINISVDFNEKARRFKANITAPHINYSGNELDSLTFLMDTDKESFNFNLGFKNITAGPLDVPKTRITGNQINNELSLNFLSYHDGEKLLNVNTKITGNRERIKLTINPDSLVLNKSKWSIPRTNEILLTKGNLVFKDLKLSKANQSIEITDKLANITKPHVAIDYTNFKISEVFNYLNPEVKLATGQLNGNFILEDPFGQTGIITDLSIRNLEVLKTDLGTLSLNGNSLSDNVYAFNAGLKGGDIDFDLVSDYTTTSSSANLNLDLNINAFKMKALNTLALGEIKNADGSFNGQLKVIGTTANPIYNGTLNFNNASFNVAKLNTQFKMQNETLHVNNDGLSMSNFTVIDENNNALVASGEIGTKDFLNPTFNLDLKASNFQVLNATAADNALFYGKASFDADAKLTGNLQIPKLDAKITVGSDTNITYVLPSTVASIEDRNGIVTFVNRENPDAILTQSEEKTAPIAGFDITTLVKIEKEAAVTIIIDEQTGDNFKISGEGDLNFTMSPNGRINLTGVYEILDGHYELNLYNLVDRKFLIAEGSRVSWSGDPFDAKLNIRAIYNVETSASSLMAVQISGSDPSVQNKYRQVLPFKVYLNIDGELTQPAISFQLDMPEEDQGAIGGQVYGRIQEINTQEGELNRQVFSLLVLNRFYPEPGSDGSTGGFATIARDNLNDAVAEQLNTFSDKILGDIGIELDFGIDSYTDYQGDTATDRTQLDIAAQKKLFNDRLTVRVGSEVDIQGESQTGETIPLIGNVSLEYALTQDGRYSLKGFHKSEFDNIIDGQTIVSGIALIFTQEFNHFDELWAAIKNKSEKKKAELRAKKEAEIKQQKAKQINTKPTKKN